MGGINRELGIYIVIALAIIIAAAVIANGLLARNYSLRVSISPPGGAALYPYQTSKLDITVDNTGPTPISGLTVGFYVNGAQQSSYKVSIPAGKSATIPVNYTYTSNGTYSFKAVADPGGVLSISNRSAAQASVSATVSQASRPDVYTSIPNSNATMTQSFTFTSQGAYSAAVLADEYNVSLFDRMFSPAQPVIVKIFELLYGYVARANGAHVSYPSKATAYTLWLQGTVTPQLVNYVISSFHAANSTVTSNGISAQEWTIDGTTSICTYYEGGWTKVIAVSNFTSDGTCASFVGKSFASHESAVLVGALKNNTNLTVFQSHMMYTNASVSGTSLVYGNGTLGAINMFQVPQAMGFFTALISTNGPNSRNASPPTCRGLLSTDANGSVCSTYIVPASGKADATYALINTTEVFSNYTLAMYSLVNQSNLINAHKNAVLLFKSLGINESYVAWETAFKNACFLHNVSGVGCTVNAFNYSSSEATVGITNNMSIAMHINRVGCFMPGANFNYTFNTTITAGSESNFTVRCVNIPVPIVSAKTSYILEVNYTTGGAFHNAIGALNVTNPGFG